MPTTYRPMGFLALFLPPEYLRPGVSKHGTPAQYLAVNLRFDFSTHHYGNTEQTLKIPRCSYANERGVGTGKHCSEDLMLKPGRGCTISRMAERQLPGLGNLALCYKKKITSLPSASFKHEIVFKMLKTEFDPVFENNMAILVEMGFNNLERNALLLKRFNNDLSQVIGVICASGGADHLNID
ncbi:hypothetical protein J6590_038476 [Homalodisca vitripennis]|nr:hypothetical protein J6590_038476 [Homalodisca vitripennis]